MIFQLKHHKISHQIYYYMIFQINHQRIILTMRFCSHTKDYNKHFYFLIIRFTLYSHLFQFANY